MNSDFSTLETDQTMLYNEWVSGFTGDAVVNNGFVSNQNVYLQPIVNPVKEVGDEPIQCFRQVVAKDPIYITTSCETPELAAQWLDYWYSEEGMDLAWYGIEGTTYEIGEDGTPQYTELVTANPDGLDSKTVPSNYTFDSNSYLGRHNWESSTKMSLSSNDIGDKDLWSSPETNIWVSESISFTDAEGVAQIHKLHFTDK